MSASSSSPPEHGHSDKRAGRPDILSEFRSTHGGYRKRAAQAIHDPRLQRSIANIQELIGNNAGPALDQLPGGKAAREQGRRLREETLAHLNVHLATLAQKIRDNGGDVYFAENGKAACDYCIDVARKHGVKLAVKGKSMVTEEIGLNHALKAAGIETVETDLGEYIIQLAGESPSHIIAPAIHKSKEEIGRLFQEKLGIEYSNDPGTLTLAARKALRKKFLAADMGISSCNMACAETGHITTVSNEGNIRMATTLPRIHVAFMGMERIAARLTDHELLLSLLTRAAAVQKMATYMSYIGGPRKDEHNDGPERFHLVILDNGRSKILGDPTFRPILNCLRCGACLNACPVYGKIGGHTYGSPYPGPIGAVISPLLFGINSFSDLCRGETLCGACEKACPVQMEIPGMLLELRAKLADGDTAWRVRRENPMDKLLMMFWSMVNRHRLLFKFTMALAGHLAPLFPGKRIFPGTMPPPLQGFHRGKGAGRITGNSFVAEFNRSPHTGSLHLSGSGKRPTGTCPSQKTGRHS